LKPGFIVLIANLLIFLSTAKESLLLYLGMRKFQKVQNAIFKTILKKNKNKKFLKNFINNDKEKPNELPLTTWQDYVPYVQEIMLHGNNELCNDEILLLEPTSGTSSATKYIPYTKGLQEEFKKAILPWLCGLYLRCPGLLFCTQYWSISPSVTKVMVSQNNHVPVGFESDTQYLGTKSSKIFGKIMAVPDQLKHLSDFRAWSYLTGYYLLRNRKLGMISIWHPTFLTILLDEIRKNFNSLLADIEQGEISIELGLIYPEGKFTFRPDKRRAAELKILNINDPDIFLKIWKNLKVISCWADNPQEPGLIEISKIFPGIWIQPKGMVATEGIFSFPFGRTYGIPAFRSHFLEFVDLKDNKLKTLNQIEKGEKYELVITTGGGLYRYKMNDIIKVMDLNKFKLPLLSFQYKNDYFSDIRGEKLNLQHIEAIALLFKEKWQLVGFFMISPVVNGLEAFYTCFVLSSEDAKLPFNEMADFVDEKLKENFHYLHARNISQLLKPAIFQLSKNPVPDIYQYFESSGVKRGDIKIYSLSNIPLWDKILIGKYVYP
jgi:hypothetical protein